MKLILKDNIIQEFIYLKSYFGQYSIVFKKINKKSSILSNPNCFVTTPFYWLVALLETKTNILILFTIVIYNIALWLIKMVLVSS